MSFTVPNAPDPNIVSLDQAEPDSLDFQALGRHRTGIISGGEVTSGSGSVGVAAAEVSINGVYGNVGSGTVAVSAADGSDPRFDLVVVRRTGSNFAYTIIQGTASATNPRFPEIDHDTDLLIAALYREPGSGSAVTTEAIVDKRVMLAGGFVRSGSGSPAMAGITGDGYVQTTGTSPLWINVNGSWVNIAVDPSAVLPVGTVITWAGYAADGPNPSYFMECDGRSLSRASYAALFNVIGPNYGSPSSTTFNIPNFLDKFPRGPAQAAQAPGQTGGANSVTLTEANLPSLTHGGTTGGLTASAQTSEDVAPAVTHTVGVNDKDHVHYMPHTHDRGLFAIPRTTRPTLDGRGGSYYRIDPRDLVARDNNLDFSIHVGIQGAGSDAGVTNIFADQDVIDDFPPNGHPDSPERKFNHYWPNANASDGGDPSTTGAWNGTVNLGPLGTVQSSAQHKHTVDPHPERRHRHDLPPHTHSLNVAAHGQSVPNPISTVPGYQTVRFFIKYL